MGKRRLAALAATLAAAGALIVSSGVIFAHARPVRFDPAPGTVVQAAPAQVQGWFTADLRRDPNWTFIHVADAQGNRVDAGEAQLSANRRQLTVPLKSGLAAGRYIVSWRTYDEADGAIFGDCYVFFVGQAAAEQAVADNFRLDGGGVCERIDVEARAGTPVPGKTPQVAAAQGATTGDDHDAIHEAEHAEDGDDGEIPVWGLVLGIAGGLGAGLVGARMLGKS